MSNTSNQIQDIAERQIRIGGFGAFSFRDIASEIGIKSSSVHYHFPTKADLAGRVARRYTDRFMESLGDPWQGEPIQLLGQMVAAFRKALADDGRMCLCGALAAEVRELPAPVAEETRRFFEECLKWLETVYGRQSQNVPQEEIRAKAVRLLALLEGAMLIAQAMGDPTRYDEATARIPR